MNAVLQARAQSAEDRFYILRYEVAEKQEKLEQAEVSDINCVIMNNLSDLSFLGHQGRLRHRGGGSQLSGWTA
jgi:hypothetical protein